MILLAQIVGFFLLIPWIIECIYPGSESNFKTVPEQVNPILFLFLMVWGYGNFRTLFWFPDLIPFFSQLEIILLCGLFVRSADIISVIRFYASAYRMHVLTWLEKNQYFWKNFCVMVKKE